MAGCSASEILSQTGWARSVAGVNPYLTLFSRGGTTRFQSDDALARMEIHELPSARGCTYVVPSGDFALALGRLVGLWDCDSEAGTIVWTSFEVKNKPIEAAVKKTELFVKEELGDARSFSLDSPKSRIPRLEALRGHRT